MRQWRWAHHRSAAACRSCLLLPQHLPLGPSPPWVRQLSDDRASCHQQLPLCQPPKPLPVPLQIRAGKDGGASRGANCPRRAGKKEKGPALSGVCFQGVMMSLTLAFFKAGSWESPLWPLLGSSHLRNVLIDFQQKCMAGGVGWTSWTSF